MILLILVLCLSLCACGGSEALAEKAEQIAALDNTPSYTAGITVTTDFGEITILDAAFCEKAQLIEALPHPAYNSAGEGRIVFAMRTQISNTSGRDLVLFDDLKINIDYGGENTFGCSKGGNYTSQDPLYKILPAGTSGEYILCGRVPVETYQEKDRFRVSFNGTELGFSRDEIPVYNAMGYQPGENAPASIESIIAAAGTAPAEDAQPSGEKPAVAYAFSLEGARYEETKIYLAIELKIRNDSDASLIWPVFNGVVLDAKGDILENCSLSYLNGLEGGQAGWGVIRISEEATLKEMASIKIVTMWDKESPEASHHGVRFDLPEPIVVDTRSLEEK